MNPQGLEFVAREEGEGEEEAAGGGGGEESGGGVVMTSVARRRQPVAGVQTLPTDWKRLGWADLDRLKVAHVD